LLFIGSAFYYKGGMETLLAFRKLRDRLPVELTMVSFVPPEARRRFGELPGLNLVSRISPDQLEALYQKTDVLVAPFHTDTLGFVILEAFAHGIPCVATDQFASRELVDDGRTGVIIDNPVSRFGPDRLPRSSLFGAGMATLLNELSNPSDRYVDRLADAIEMLARDKRKRMAMSEAAFAEVGAGRFSIEARKKALAPVYRLS
jgi:glycosyltransferase involved in cell wall biosynthesis